MRTGLSGRDNILRERTCRRRTFSPNSVLLVFVQTNHAHDLRFDGVSLSQLQTLRCRRFHPFISGKTLAGGRPESNGL